MVIQAAMSKKVRLPNKTKTNVLAVSKRASQRKRWLKARFGGRVSSIIPINRTRNRHVILYQEPGQGLNVSSYLPRTPWGVEITLSGSQKGNLSIMPYDLVRFVLEFYTRPGDLYYDPCAGHGVRMQVAKLMGRRYVGYDVCARYVAFIREKILPVLDEMGQDATAEIY